MAALQREHQSDWELATEYFGNLTVVSAVLLTFYVIAHILLCKPHEPQGLEIKGLHLPDSFGQLITCGILVLLLERVCNMALHFIQARLYMGNHLSHALLLFKVQSLYGHLYYLYSHASCAGSDHGIKSQGDGWVVTVALVEAVNLPPLDTRGSSDPFVVLMCNGKTRTSSVQLQTCDPQWNGLVFTPHLMYSMLAFFLSLITLS